MSPSELVVDWFCSLGVPKFVDVCDEVDLSCICQAVLVHDVPLPLPEPWRNSVLSLVVAKRACELDTYMLDDGSALGVIFRGPEHAVSTLLDFWSSILPDALLTELGFRIDVARDTGVCKIALIGSVNAPFIPVHLICIHLFVRGLSSILAPDLYALPSKLRYYHRTVWSGYLPGLYSAEYLMEIVHCVTFWISPCLRPLIAGRQFDWRLSLDQLVNQGLLKIDFVRPCHGGGVGGNGTKQSHKLQVQNALATALLKEGYELHWITTSIATVISKMGHKDFSKCLTSALAARLQIALQAMRDCQISIPDIKPSRTSQSAFAKKKKLQPAPLPNPANYRVIDGALLNQDDSHAVFTPSFSGQLTGYHCISPVEAIPWLQAGETLSKDELVLLVFGDLECPTTRPHEKLTIPCVDEQSRHVLVAVTMVQFGEKHIKKQTGDGFQVDSDATTLLAVTLEIGNFQEDWSEIVTSPFKYLR